MARRGEGGTRDLLGIQAMGHALGRVAAEGQGASDSLGGEFVAEAGLVAGMDGGGGVGHAQPVLVDGWLLGKC